MAPLTIFLSRLIGLFTLVVSLSMVLHKHSTVVAVTMLAQDRPLLFVVGMIFLISGIAMALGHNVWTGGVLPVVVTFFGWITLIRGALLLILPPEAITATFEFFHFEKLFYLYAGVAFALGLYLVYAGLKAKPAASAGRAI
jgi:hypothetical protein